MTDQSVVEPEGSVCLAGPTERQATLHFYLPSFAGGGAERVFVRLANHLADEGYTVNLIVNEACGPLLELLSERVRVHELGAPKAMLALPRLVRYLRTERPATLVSALTRTNIAALLAVRIAGTNTRVIVCERNQYSATLKELDMARRVVINWCVKRLYPRAHAVIGNTAEVARDIAEAAGLEASKTGVIPNPAPDPLQIEAARAEDVPHPWLADDEPVAVAIGRLVPQKDYPTLLKAVARAESKPRLLVLGEGEERPKLEALAEELGIRDRVDFVGFRMNRFAYLTRADVFILSSTTEGFPNVLIEAMAAGVPAVATDCAGGGPREILGTYFQERLVPVRDATALASAIDRVVQQRPPAPGEAERIRIVAQRYRIEEVARAFVEKATG
jgi:glycosyltransferase involved in cell wall biosynthesis